MDAGSSTAGRRRGLLASMWEFPNGTDGLDGVRQLTEGVGVTIDVDEEPIGTLKHVFSPQDMADDYLRRPPDWRESLWKRRDWQWLPRRDVTSVPWAGPHGKNHCYGEMKGPFFINFMIIMSCICVCSAVLWNYIYRRSRWLALVVFVAAATVIAGAGLSYYGRVFPAVQGTVEGCPHVRLLGGYQLVFPVFPGLSVLVVASAAVFIERRLRRWKQSGAA